MKKIFLIFLMFGLALSNTITYGMRRRRLGRHRLLRINLDVFAIPGQNGNGGNPEYVRNCLGNHDARVTQIETPDTKIDLGQEHCMSHLRDALDSDEVEDVVIHATSQGTATALNYLATEDRGEKIRGVIL